MLPPHARTLQNANMIAFCSLLCVKDAGSTASCLSPGKLYSRRVTLLLTRKNSSLSQRGQQKSLTSSERAEHKSRLPKLNLLSSHEFHSLSTPQARKLLLHLFRPFSQILLVSSRASGIGVVLSLKPPRLVDSSYHIALYQANCSRSFDHTKGALVLPSGAVIQWGINI